MSVSRNFAVFNYVSLQISTFSEDANKQYGLYKTNYCRNLIGGGGTGPTYGRNVVFRTRLITVVGSFAHKGNSWLCLRTAVDIRLKYEAKGSVIRSCRSEGR